MATLWSTQRLLRRPNGRAVVRRWRERKRKRGAEAWHLEREGFPGQIVPKRYIVFVSNITLTARHLTQSSFEPFEALKMFERTDVNTVGRSGSPTNSAESDSSPRLSKDLGEVGRNRILTHTRSNNGYGCDGGTEDVTVMVAGGGDDLERHITDPFAVCWDGGDDDPANPRSWSMVRRWVVVLIVSTSSMSV
jgi:hypothetical protein